jgi:fluoroquinolone resistance protein
MNDLFSTEEKYIPDKEFIKITQTENEIRGFEFNKCQFNECNFYKTKFIDCVFEDCLFDTCDLSLISFLGSRLLDINFTNTKIIGVDWTVIMKPYRFSFNKCKLDNSSFYKMELTNLNINECSAREVDFIESNLSRVKFPFTDLYRSRFNGANLSFADFSNSTNYSIDPNQCKLKKTIFTLPEAVSLLNGFDVVIK